MATASIVSEKEMKENFFHGWLNNFDSHCIYIAKDAVANLIFEKKYSLQ